MAVSVALDRARACADRALECASKYVTSQLTIRVRQWTGERLGVGAPVDTDLTLPKKYPISRANQRQVLASAGRMEVGDLIVDDIVPAFTAHGGGGFTEQQLTPQKFFPADKLAREVIYILTGDIDGRWMLVQLNNADPVFWSLVLRKTQDRAALGEVA